MSHSRHDASPGLDGFLAAILGKADPADTAAFTRAVLGQSDPKSAAAFAARILGEANFNPNQPRDEIGRWTAGGSHGDRLHAISYSAPGTSGASEEPPEGTKENGYKGVGTWGFKTEKETIAFFEDLLKPEQNKLPEDWLRVVKDGCVGLNLVRVGWAGLRKTPTNAFFTPDSVFYTRREVAEAKLRELRKANPEKTYLLIAGQLPTSTPQGRKGNAAKIARALGDAPITYRTFGLSLDLNRRADYNFSTWFPTRAGGYWEYMNHHWLAFDPNDPPKVKHGEDLPEMGPEFLTLYGVVQKRSWTK